jgi:uncharacterized protein (DUF1501 family)
MDKRKTTRREFLGQASCAAVGSTAFASTILSLMMTSAASAQTASTDYRAIVCLFLPGGNDSYNLLVPYGLDEYREYATVRGDLALPHENLIPLTPLNNPGRDLAFHPGMGAAAELFNAEKLAVLANVGSLVRPTTLAEFNNGISLPYGLFSHSDQQEQWQTSIPDERSGIGWAGRVADLLAPQNNPSPVSMNISIAGNNLLQVGNTAVPYVSSPWGATSLWGYKDWSPYSAIRSQAVDSLLAAEYSSVLDRTFNSMKKGSRDAYQQFVQALAVGLPEGVTFPDNDLGRQLQQVAQIIAGRQVLGVKRQVFYIQWGGWDFHDDVVTNMDRMMPIVCQGMKAFYDATVAMGVSNSVTLFTASDFGRSLTSNAKGSDHAWGGNHMMVGGAVRGKRIYGQYPDLYLGSGLDTGRGCLIPTTSVDQYAAELALWLGVPRSSLGYVLPNIGRFYDTSSPGGPLGFLV